MDQAARLTARVVSEFVSHQHVPPNQVSSLILEVADAINRCLQKESGQVKEPPIPAVPIKRSIAPGHVVCLDCGRRFRSLRRHLFTDHHMSPDDYREKWDLPSDYPMVAPEYAAQRSLLAKRMGLGHRRRES